jgi:hypothetical protein
MTKLERPREHARLADTIRHWSFVIRASFVIRTSSFVIDSGALRFMVTPNRLQIDQKNASEAGWRRFSRQ